MNSLFFKRAVSTTLASASFVAIYYQACNFDTSSEKNRMLPPYEANFQVPMHCDACVKDISGALSALPGIQSTSFSLPSQILSIKGNAPPSAIINKIQFTGRTAILRGTGASDSAAVSILELPPTVPLPQGASPVRGLARLIQLSEKLTLLDLTLSGLAPGTYTASLRSAGDTSRGVRSMGQIYRGEKDDRAGELGSLEVDKDGRGELVGEVDWRVWEMVGRGIVVQRKADARGGGDGTVVGVVARSAGAWENEKVVCGCSGKTVWEEREEMVRKGML